MPAAYRACCPNNFFLMNFAFDTFSL